jgi:hypothetical protein
MNSVEVYLKKYHGVDIQALKLLQTELQNQQEQLYHITRLHQSLSSLPSFTTRRIITEPEPIIVKHETVDNDVTILGQRPQQAQRPSQRVTCSSCTKGCVKGACSCYRSGLSCVVGKCGCKDCKNTEDNLIHKFNDMHVSPYRGANPTYDDEWWKYAPKVVDVKYYICQRGSFIHRHCSWYRCSYRGRDGIGHRSLYGRMNSAMMNQRYTYSCDDELLMIEIERNTL